MAENTKYHWLYRRLPNSELKDHVIYKAMPLMVNGRRVHPGGWSWLDEENYSPWQKGLRRRERENKEKLSRG